MNPQTAHHFERSDLFGGKGKVRIWNLLTSPSSPFVASLWCSLEGNGYVGPHKQKDHPEIVICLSGEGKVTVQGVKYNFIRGVQVYLPLGATLSIKNTDSQELIYLIIKANE